MYLRDRLIRFSFYQVSKPLSWYGFQWDSTGRIRGIKWMKSFTRTDGDLGSAVAAATGVSMGSAHTIPRLLLPGKIGGRHLLRTKNPISLAGVETLDGQACIILELMEGQNTLMKIWIDEDSLLIRQIMEPGRGSITVYHPAINKPLPASEIVFEGRRESLSVFWKYFWIEFGGVLLSILTIIVLAISWFLRKGKRKRGWVPNMTRQTGPPAIIKYTVYGIAILTLVHSFFRYALDPGLITTVSWAALALILVLIVSQHLVLPDWLFRYNRFLPQIWVLMIGAGFGLGFFLSLREINPESSDIAGWLVPIFVMVLFYFLVVIQKEWKAQQKLVHEIPCPDEKKTTVSAAAGLVESKDNLSGHKNEGRLLLFHNRLVFVAIDGTLTTLPFTSIRNISVHKEWLVVPVGLRLTDYENQTRYLVVSYPYYWKSKVRKS
jgi:hypothetical protein